jgi:5-methyltetrahydropteroyltriglutamate--homocysteine methyltransferase
VRIHGHRVRHEKTSSQELSFDNLNGYDLNHALSDIPEDQIRYHICWGNYEGPHTHDIPLKDIVDLMLRVRAGAYSVEASNPRHAHEWQMWEGVTLPEGKILIPGVIDSTTNFVEHH